MQIFIASPDQESNYNEGSQQELLNEIKLQLSSLEPELSVETDKPGNIGRGADFGGFLLFLGAAWFVFSQGKTIEENLEAWPKLAHRLIETFQRIRAHFGPIRISREIAVILAVGELFKQVGPSVKRIKLLRESKTSMEQLFWRSKEHLDYDPDCFYHFQFIVNDQKHHNVTIMSTGKVTYSATYPSMWTDFYEFDSRIDG